MNYNEKERYRSHPSALEVEVFCNDLLNNKELQPAESLLLKAILLFLKDYVVKESQNFFSLVSMVEAAATNDSDDLYKKVSPNNLITPLDYVFEEIKEEDDNEAYLVYQDYKKVLIHTIDGNLVAISVLTRIKEFVTKEENA